MKFVIEIPDLPADVEFDHAWAELTVQGWHTDGSGKTYFDYELGDLKPILDLLNAAG